MTTDITMYECHKHSSSLTLKEAEDEEKAAAEEMEDVCEYVHMHKFMHTCVYIHIAPFYFLICVIFMRLSKNVIS
jgi:hypothetical protein